MAKKKRKEAKKAKVMKKVKKVESRTSPKQSAYMLSLTAGIIVVIAGILAILQLRPFALVGETIVGIAVGSLINIISGIILLLATVGIKRTPRISAIIILVFSIVALIVPPYGLILGPLLGLVGSVILLIRR